MPPPCPAGCRAYRRVAGRPAPLTLEIGPYRRLLHLRKFVHGAHALNHTVAQHRDAIGHAPEQVEVVGDHHDGQAEQLAQGQHQFVEPIGTDRIEPGGGFVKEQQFRVEREGTSQGGTLEHAAAQLRGVLRADFGHQARHLDLPGGDIVDQCIVQRGVLAQGQADVLEHRQGVEEAAVLKHHTPALPQGLRLSGLDVHQIDAEHADRSGIRPMQQDHFAQ
jgi:hypothetical protein